jgi:CRISPR-associated protein Cas2
VVVIIFVIITYDVDVKRVSKVHKILKKYLIWSQNSVFEGEITEGKLKQCLGEIQAVIHPDFDSLSLYQIPNPKNIKKVVFGQEKAYKSMFL